MFIKTIIDKNYYDELSKLELEDVGKGRRIGVFTNGWIIRSTACYRKSSPFSLLDNLVNKLGIDVNNGLVEIYDSSYNKMKFHTDQSLDIEEGSNIYLYSCYSDPTKGLRKLVIKNKLTNETEDIVLENNSLIRFSTETNQKYLHKIILNSEKTDNKWLGVTLKKSKLYNNPLYGNYLRLATDEEKKEFIKLKSYENKLIDFKYPEIEYTISEGDLCFK